MGIAERKEREFLRREQEILDAALGLFATDDWQAVTVEQIAERAEIGKGTVYKHFASKDEIYARLATDFHQKAVERLERIDRSLPVMQRLRLIIAVFWEQHREMGAEYQHLVQYCEREDFRKSLSPEAQGEMARLDARFQAVIDGVLDEGIAQGILPNKPKEEMLFGAIAAMNGATKTACNCLPPDTPREQYLTVLTNFILAGMLYQDWLAEEGLDDHATTDRALAEMREIEAELEAERRGSEGTSGRSKQAPWRGGQWP